MRVLQKEISLFFLLVAVAVSEASHSETLRAKAGGSDPVTIASGLLGTPYRFGGTTPYGMDCSGLVYYSYTKAGLKVPRTTGEQFQSSFPVARNHLKPGDLLFFKIEGKVSHVGMFVGEDRFIHAPSSGKKVSYSSLNNPYWRKRLVKVGRFF